MSEPYHAVINDAINAHQEDLRKLCIKIHSTPELAWEEFQAHDNIVALLRELGHSVQPSAYGLETSFEAEYSSGEGGRTVVVNAEYDALPGIGHACGHNLIATASFAAYLAVAALLKANTGVNGSVRLLGCPAEEGGGGKAALIAQGAYENVDCAVLAHPAGLYRGYGKEFNGIVHTQHTAVTGMTAVFIGKNAHAAIDPFRGINAVDAAVIAYNNIAMLRQQVRSDCRVHVIITDGGVKANVIPSRGALEVQIRAPAILDLAPLKQRILNCLNGAALASGCGIEITSTMTYADLPTNEPLGRVFMDETMKLGNPFTFDINTPIVAGSTDQGNVSYITPAYQVTFGIPTADDATPHTAPFHKEAGKPEAFKYALEVAKGMAASLWKVLSDDEIAAEVKAYHDKQKADRARLMPPEEEWKALTHYYKPKQAK